MAQGAWRRKGTFLADRVVLFLDIREVKRNQFQLSWKQLVASNMLNYEIQKRTNLKCTRIQINSLCSDRTQNVRLFDMDKACGKD